jgi:hypothetical protein
MNTKNYTKSNKHPDDAIFETKTFLNELSKIQNQYFENLLQDLNLSEEGEGWLFDFIFNGDEQDNKMLFTEFLEDRNKKYEDFCK